MPKPPVVSEAVRPPGSWATNLATATDVAANARVWGGRYPRRARVTIIMSSESTVAGSHRYLLLPSAYHSLAWFDQELDTLFAARWALVATTDDFTREGDYVAVTVGRSALVVVCGADGRLRAFHNLSRHRGISARLRPWDRRTRRPAPGFVVPRLRPPGRPQPVLGLAQPGDAAADARSPAGPVGRLLGQAGSPSGPLPDPDRGGREGEQARRPPRDGHRPGVRRRRGDDDLVQRRPRRSIPTASPRRWRPPPCAASSPVPPLPTACAGWGTGCWPPPVAQ